MKVMVSLSGTFKHSSIEDSEWPCAVSSMRVVGSWCSVVAANAYPDAITTWGSVTVIALVWSLADCVLEWFSDRVLAWISRAREFYWFSNCDGSSDVIMSCSSSRSSGGLISSIASTAIANALWLPCGVWDGDNSLRLLYWSALSKWIEYSLSRRSKTEWLIAGASWNLFGSSLSKSLCFYLTKFVLDWSVGCDGGSEESS